MPGRNEPCPCGSGKKYKKCCLQSEENEIQNLVAEVDALNDLSNSVVDLIDDGKLDEAEAVCYRLQKDYPDQVDGIDRLALVYKARGDYRQAASYYTKAAAFAVENHFDQESIAFFKQQANQMLAKI